MLNWLSFCKSLFINLGTIFNNCQKVDNWYLPFIKGENSFSNDELIEGGRRGRMYNGVNYREVRQYQTDFHLIRFYFVTRAYNTYIESILTDLCEDPKPDVVIMNSCLWDISR